MSKDKFIEIYSANIKREGADILLAWLEKTDFFTAPASTKHHLACEGGLNEHSINVYNRFECDNDETRAICALLHDLCKANFYKLEWKNQKVYCKNGSKHDDGGNFDWQTVQGYTYDEKFPFGHGEKSVFLIERFIKLTVEEAVAIRFHMGPYEGERAWNNVSSAFEKYPLAFNLHIADMKATYLDEKRD